jgi:predicted site-specific integrase-resolvase
MDSTQDSSGKHFLNAEQAVQHLGGLNPRTLTRWARESYIPAYPIGEGKRRLWRFRAEDLDAWMLARRNSASAAIVVDSHRCSDRRLS